MGSSTPTCATGAGSLGTGHENVRRKAKENRRPMEKEVRRGKQKEKGKDLQEVAGYAEETIIRTNVPAIRGSPKEDGTEGAKEEAKGEKAYRVHMEKVS